MSVSGIYYKIVGNLELLLLFILLAVTLMSCTTKSTGEVNLSDSALTAPIDTLGGNADKTLTATDTTKLDTL